MNKHKMLAYDKRNKTWGEICLVGERNEEFVMYSDGSKAEFEHKFHAKALSDSPSYWRYVDIKVNEQAFLENPISFLEDVLVLRPERAREPLSVSELKSAVTTLTGLDLISRVSKDSPLKVQQSEAQNTFRKGILGLKKFHTSGSKFTNNTELVVPKELEITIEYERLPDITDDEPRSIDFREIAREVLTATSDNQIENFVANRRNHIPALFKGMVEHKQTGSISNEVKKEFIEQLFETVDHLIELKNSDPEEFDFVYQWISKTPIYEFLPVLLIPLEWDKVSGLVGKIPKDFLNTLTSHYLCDENLSVHDAKLTSLLANFLMPVIGESNFFTIVGALRVFSANPALASQRPEVLKECELFLTEHLLFRSNEIQLSDALEIPEYLAKLPWDSGKRDLLIACQKVGVRIDQPKYWFGLDWKLFRQLELSSLIQGSRRFSKTDEVILDVVVSRQNLTAEILIGVYQLGTNAQTWLLNHLDQKPQIYGEISEEFRSNPNAQALVFKVFGIPDTREIQKRGKELEAENAKMREELVANKNEIETLKAKAIALAKNLDETRSQKTKLTESSVAKSTFNLSNLVAKILGILDTNLGKVPNEQVFALIREESRLMGIAPIGSKGEETYFASELHECEQEVLQEGERVLVRQPGYVLIGQVGEYILEKAKVSPSMGL